MKGREGDVHADPRGRRIRISTPFPFTAELQPIPLGDLVMFWNYDIQTVFHTVEFSTNSLRVFVACWNYDLYTVHSGAFSELSGGMCGILNL